MALRPVDKDVLEDVSESIARKNYGFLYVSDYKGEIKEVYENADTGMMNAGSINASDLREALTSLANDEFRDLKRIRDGVYYFDPFGATSNESITDELIHLFSQRLVVTGETLRSRFSLAIDDIEFFVDELSDRNYVRRIRAGKKDYYTIGPGLKEHAEDVGLDTRLQSEASYGKISHSDLESVIDVSATTDVLRYLEKEDLIIDLDGEYLVKSLLGEYGQHLADKIAEAVEDEFEAATYILQIEEFEQIVENEIRNRFDVLSSAREVEGKIIEQTRLALESRLGIKTDQSVAIQTEQFQQHIEAEARRILNDVQAEINTDPGMLEGWVEAAEDHFKEIRVNNTTTVNDHVREEIKQQYKQIVDEEKFGGMAL